MLDTSGVVIGLLLARTFAGVLTDLWGWRSVYLTSAVLMLLIVGLLYQNLPDLGRKPTAMSYPQLLHSVLLLFVQERILLIRGILALLIFTSFSILWTSLVLPLSSAPYYLSHTAIGAFGFAGIAGAIAATRAGRLADRGLGQLTTGIALSLLVIAWLLAVHPEAASRLTAVYMIYYSIGSATGSIASTNIYAIYGWNGVCLLGASVSAFAFILGNNLPSEKADLENGVLFFHSAVHAKLTCNKKGTFWYLLKKLLPSSLLF